MRYYFFLIGLFLISCKSEVKSDSKDNSPVAERTPLLISQDDALPSGDNSSLPRLFATEDKLYLSWVEQKDSLAELYYSVYENGSWTPGEMIISGIDWFVNWADFPAIAEKDGNLLNSFLQKSADGTYTYDVKLNLYSAQEDSWNKNFVLHDDGTQSEHGFVSMVPTDEDDFFLVWLDGRETVGKEHGGGQMTLRGAFVDMDGNINGDSLLDGKVCDCCQTTAAMTSQGPIVAYRDRSDSEIRDISVVRGVDGIWTEPQTIGADNWEIAGCPVNGPSMDTFGTSVGLAWFTAASGEGIVQVAFSGEDGENFGEPVRIDSGNAIGRVDLSMLDADSAVITWLEPKGDDTLIQLRKINSDGTMGTAVTVTTTSAERASGFPQLERLGDSLYVVWTSVDEDNSKLRGASVMVSHL